MKVEWIVEYTHGLFSLLASDVSADSEVTDETIARGASVNEDLTGIDIFVPRDSGFAHLVIEVVEQRPEIDFERWDRVLELSVCSVIGAFEFSSTCGSDVRDAITQEEISSDFRTEPGIYQLYLMVGNLTKTLERLNGPEDGDWELLVGQGIPAEREALLELDHYHIVMWPLSTKVLKQIAT